MPRYPDLIAHRRAAGYEYTNSWHGRLQVDLIPVGAPGNSWSPRYPDWIPRRRVPTQVGLFVIDPTALLNRRAWHIFLAEHREARAFLAETFIASHVIGTIVWRNPS